MLTFVAVYCNDNCYAQHFINHVVVIHDLCVPRNRTTRSSFHRAVDRSLDTGTGNAEKAAVASSALISHTKSPMKKKTKKGFLHWIRSVSQCVCVCVCVCGVCTPCIIYAGKWLTVSLPICVSNQSKQWEIISCHVSL